MKPEWLEKQKSTNEESFVCYKTVKEQRGEYRVKDVQKNNSICRHS